jgi:hypothetical protein
MLQKTIDILKIRWREVLLVVTLQAGVMVLGEEIIKIAEAAEVQKTQMAFGPSFLLGMGTMGVAIVWLILYLGFLKTAALEGHLMRQPEQLIRIGRPYFWRYLFFNIQIHCVIFLLSSAVFGLFASTVWKGRQMQDIPEWFVQVCGLGVLVGLIKPMLFIPARIIVYNNNAVEGLFSMGRYRMGRVHQLNQSIAIGFAVILLATLIYTLLPEETTVYYVFLGIHHVLFALVPMFLTLMVVLWVQDECNAKMRAAEEEENQS